MVGSDAAIRVKSRKPPPEYLITSLSVTVFQVGGGADDVVGDQMRHVAGDREHQIVMFRIHAFDPAAHALPERLQRLDGAGSAPGGGVMISQRPSNNSAKPASGPDCSVPAIGWAGMR